MRKSRPIVRPATREDIEAFSDLRNKPTLRAWVGEIDGRIIAIGGLAFSKGRWFGFCDLSDEARQYKMTIARTAKMVLDEARRQGIRFVYAEAGQNERGASRWLISLGFIIDPRSGYLYRWGV